MDDGKLKVAKLLLPFTFFILPVVMPFAVQAKVLDRTVATVNADAIMLSEYQKNAEPILEQFRKTAPASEQTPEHVADIKKRVLDQMVDDRLLIQESKKKAIRVSLVLHSDTPPAGLSRPFQFSFKLDCLDQSSFRRRSKTRGRV